jgi:hypothetical protein
MLYRRLFKKPFSRWAYAHGKKLTAYYISISTKKYLKKYVLKRTKKMEIGFQLEPEFVPAMVDALVDALDSKQAESEDDLVAIMNAYVDAPRKAANKICCGKARAFVFGEDLNWEERSGGVESDSDDDYGTETEDEIDEEEALAHYRTMDSTCAEPARSVA